MALDTSDSSNSEQLALKGLMVTTTVNVDRRVRVCVDELVQVG